MFALLLERLVPLYLIVVAGYIAGRRLHVQRESIAKLLLYFIVPTVVVTSISQMQMTRAYLSLPFLFFGACCLMCGVFLWVGRRVFRHNRVLGNLLAFGAGDGNTGYFGMPVAIQMFGPDIVGIAVLCLVGFVVYENSVGFYVAARGRYDAREAWRRLVRLPTIYAFAAGVALSASGHPISGPLAELGVSARGAYSVLGMMMIGLGAAAAAPRLREIVPDWKFMGWSFVAKFVAWPALTLAFVAWDRASLGLYTTDPRIHPMMVLISSVPLAANSVAISTELKSEPEKVAIAVLLSTLVALGVIPLVSLLAKTLGAA